MSTDGSRKDIQKKVKEVRRKKGGLDPAIVIHRPEGEPVQLIVRGVRPPVASDDYVAVDVSDSDFVHIVKTFQGIDLSQLRLSRPFDTAAGGRARSEMEYYNSLELMERFVDELYGTKNFFRQPMNARLTQIPPLDRAHAIVNGRFNQNPEIFERGPQTSVFPLIDSLHGFTTKEFESLLPLVEGLFLWKVNLEEGHLTVHFRNAISQRIREGDASAFYGHLSEVYFNGLYIYAGARPLYLENPRARRPRKQLDWALDHNGGQIGIECKDFRQQQEITLNSIEDKVKDTIEKLEGSRARGLQLSDAVLWINATRCETYQRPDLAGVGTVTAHEPPSPIAGELKPRFSLSSPKGSIAGVAIAWREKISRQDSIEYVQRYVITPGIEGLLPLPILQPVIHVSSGRRFFVRKFVYPEPKWRAWRPEETRPQSEDARA